MIPSRQWNSPEGCNTAYLLVTTDGLGLTDRSQLPLDHGAFIRKVQQLPIPSSNSVPRLAYSEGCKSADVYNYTVLIHVYNSTVD